MSEGKGITRRDFLIQCALAGAGIGLSRPNVHAGGGRVLGANDRLRVAMVGVGRQGGRHLAEYLRLPGVEVCALCDTDEQKLRAQAELLARAGLRRPALFEDFRRILDSQEVDAISVATPTRWHAPMAIAGCEAGKDVYLEKPCAATFAEGKRLVAAAERYGRVVQQRAGATFAVSPESAPLLMSPTLGEVRSVKGVRRVYLSPLPGAGGLVAEALDEIDLARAMLEVKLPSHVSTVTMEGVSTRMPSRVAIRLSFKQGEESERALNFEIIGSPALNGGAAPAGDAGRAPTSATHGPAGGGAAEFDSFNTFVTAGGDFTLVGGPAAIPVENDWANFISSVRRRDARPVNSSIEEARLSCALVHLAQLSLRHRRGFEFDPLKEEVVGDEEINEALAK